MGARLPMGNPGSATDVRMDLSHVKIEDPTATRVESLTYTRIICEKDINTENSRKVNCLNK